MIEAATAGKTITTSISTALTNTGTLRAISGGTLIVDELNNQVGGLAEVDDAGSTLVLTGSWGNPLGDLDLLEGTLNLGGTFTDLGMFNRAGGIGTVNLQGEFTPVGAAFEFDLNTGVFNFDNGEIVGATLTRSGI